MRILIAAVGKLKAGPETELVTRYLDRLRRTGKSIGITSVDMLEIAESRAASSQLRKAEEAASLLSKIPTDHTIFAFDESGKSPSSQKFSRSVQRHLDTGSAGLAFVIGGPDGHGPELRDRASELVSFGSLTLPHQIVRVLVAEQLYRCATILTNHPYHRE